MKLLAGILFAVLVTVTFLAMSMKNIKEGHESNPLDDHLKEIQSIVPTEKPIDIKQDLLKRGEEIKKNRKKKDESSVPKIAVVEELTPRQQKLAALGFKPYGGHGISVTENGEK